MTTNGTNLETAADDDLAAGLTAALQPLFDELAAATVYTWHSSTIAEDGRLLVLFDGDDGRTWGFTIDPGKPLDGQPATFRRMD